ncbi:MAG: transporter substrate-binding domain-containing protein [Variibacter sp.]
MQPKIKSKLKITRALCGLGLALAAAVLVAGLADTRPARAQPATSPAAKLPPALAVPGFWDPKRRQEKPVLQPTTVIRFLTETNYPPFDYAGPDGNPIGFNVDLARLICDELKVACTVQMRRFDTLVDALAENRGDAAIASMAATPDNRRKVEFTDPYYRSPARFVARSDTPIKDVLPERLEGKKIAAVAGSAHEAYLKAFFTEAEVKPYPTLAAATEALRNGEADLLFGDGIQLAFWLNGSDSQSCCAFRGGPFLESRYFGDGIGIAVKRGNQTLRQALNWALYRLWETGRFTDLWLRYFPINPF